MNYSYDAWGNCISMTGSKASTIGALNPIRYREYYYDTETGFYFLQSRYYDPEIGRFINADAAEYAGENLFAYCYDDPMDMADYNGAWPEWLVKKLAGQKNWDDMNVQERKLACNNPFQALHVATARSQAYKWEKYWFGDQFGQDHTRANAFRHAMWNAAMTYLMGAANTKKWADAHEYGQTGAATKMDYYNNARGREIGARFVREKNAMKKNRNKYFIYYHQSISLNGDPYYALSLMVIIAIRRGVLTWIK